MLKYCSVVIGSVGEHTCMGLLLKGCTPTWVLEMDRDTDVLWKLRKGLSQCNEDELPLDSIILNKEQLNSVFAVY